MNKISLIVACAVLLIMSQGCGNGKKAGHDGHNHAEKQEAQDKHKQYETVHLSGAQAKYAKIDTGDFIRMQLSETVKATGRLQLPPRNEAKVSPVTGGIVKDIYVITGDYVEKGEKLAKLGHPQIVEKQRNYLESREQLKYLKEDYERVRGLYDSSVVSAKKYQKTRSEYKRLNAKVNSLERQLRLMGITPESLNGNAIRSHIWVRSPLEGYIREVNIRMGEYVETNRNMIEVVDNNHLHIDLMVFEQDVHKIRKGQKVWFNFANNPVASPLEAVVFATGKALDNRNKAVRMHAEVRGHNNHEQLIPGMYVESWIVTDSTKQKSVPSDALIQEDDGHYIFVMAPEYHHDSVRVFERVEVVPGVTDKGYTEISLKDPLPERHGFVVRGAHYLQRELKKGAGGHSH